MAAHGSIEIQIHSADACIVTLRGEHDVASSDAVSLALAAARGYGNILVDLAGCTFVDSSLIHALLVAAKRARQLHGALEVVLPEEPNAVRRTLEIANVQMILPFHASREEGLASITSQRPPPADAPSRPRRLAASASDLPPLPARDVRGRVGPRRGAGLVLRAQVVDEGASPDGAGARRSGRRGDLAA
jgi:anti-anti-sigma factor